MAKRYPFISQKDDLKIDICAVVDLIVQTQLPDGAIPWSAGDKLDPWDHVESAIGLTIGGAFDAARKAYLWLEQHQLPGGGWHAAYKDGSVTDATRETNHAAYIAVGLYHYYLVTQDYSFLKRMWPALAAAMNFVLDLQGPGGEIYWAVSPKGQVDPMALLTGCSSICFSLKCAFVLSMLLDKPQPKWRRGYERLRDCIRTKPHRFNMTKARFSMDWFYPVLCGVFTGDEAKKRIEKHWKKFVINNLGVRCVSDQPWITIAESSELVLALNAMGDDLLARVLFGWIIDHTFSDGTFWCGFTCPDMVLWPEEKITWTNAVVLMAADALYDLTPAAGLFRHGR